MSEVFDADHSAQTVALTGLQANAVAVGVGGFDADHLQIALRAHIAEARGFFDPGVPHHGAAGTVIVDANKTLEAGVVDADWPIYVLLNAVQFAVKVNRTALQAGAVVVDRIAKGFVFQPGNGDVGDIRDRKVTVQGRADGGGLGAAIVACQ